MDLFAGFLLLLLLFFNTYKFRLESDTKLNTILRPEEAGQQSRNIFHQSDSSLNTLRADPENLSKARVVAVIFGFPSFVFNELSWDPSQCFDVKICFLEESS